MWVARHTGWSIPRDTGIGLDFRGDAVTVLTLLLDDPDPKVRWFAAEGLVAVGADARPAIPALRRLRDDPADMRFGNTVGKAAADAIERIDGH